MSQDSYDSRTNGTNTSDTKLKPKRNRTGTAIEISAMTLQVLKDVGDSSPVPGVGAIASLALEILKAVQNARENKDAFQRLGSDAAAVAIAVTTQFKEIEDNNQKVPPLLQDHAKTLERTLEEIRDFANIRSQRNPFRRILSSRSDGQAIQEYREQLQQAMSLFGVQSQLELRTTLDRVELLLRQQRLSGSPEPIVESPTIDSSTADIKTIATPLSLKTPHSSETAPTSSETPISTPSGTSVPGLSHSPSNHNSGVSPPQTPICTSPTARSGSSSPALFSNSQASITGSVTFNSISGDQNITTNNVNNSNVNTGNVYHRNRTMTFHAYGPDPSPGPETTWRHSTVPGWSGWDPGYSSWGSNMSNTSPRSRGGGRHPWDLNHGNSVTIPEDQYSSHG